VLRIIHPQPVLNTAPQSQTLDIPHLVLRNGRKCGPAQLGGGHWIHLDCNVHVPVANAQPASLMIKRIQMIRTGMLSLVIPTMIVPSQPGGGPPPPAPLPDSVDHNALGLEGPIKDQGQVGSCTSFSLSSAMDNGIRKQSKGDTMSSLHIWSHYGFPAMSNAAQASLNRVIAPWSTWVYDERVACEFDQSGEPGDCGPYVPAAPQGGYQSDPNAVNGQKTADGFAAQNGGWKVTEFDTMPTDPDSIATVLAAGTDVWFSMDIGNSWMNPNGDTIADWDSNSIDGGHAVLFSGYRHVNGQRQFEVHNSWGNEWGNNGYAYISENMVKQFIKTAYKVVVANSNQPPPPPNTSPQNNPNALTDDDCAANQLVDSVTGQCAQMCPDDSRPANGVCDGGASAKHKPGRAPAPTKAEPPKPAPKVEPKRH
jgi:hypothetical protein